MKTIVEQLNLGFEGVLKDKFGRPYLSHGNISLAHTKQYAAVAYHSNHACGIDIEYISERVRHIRHKFLNQKELRAFGHSLKTLTIAWCAKEAPLQIAG